MVNSSIPGALCTFGPTKTNFSGRGRGGEEGVHESFAYSVHHSLSRSGRQAGHLTDMTLEHGRPVTQPQGRAEAGFRVWAQTPAH